MAITLNTVLHLVLALFVFALVAGALWYLLNAVLALLPAPAQRFANVIRAFIYLLLVIVFIDFLLGGIGGFRL